MNKLIFVIIFSCVSLIVFKLLVEEDEVISKGINSASRNSVYKMIKLPERTEIQSGKLSDFYDCIKQFKTVSAGSKFVPKEHKGGSLRFALLLDNSLMTKFEFSGTKTMTTLFQVKAYFNNS